MKYYGKIGFADTVETSPDVWKETIVEYPYYGDVLNFGRSISAGSEINDALSVQTKISIVADPYARKHYLKMKYIVWQDVKWKVSNVEVGFPRLTLTLGGLYNESDTEN